MLRAVALHGLVSFPCAPAIVNIYIIVKLTKALSKSLTKKEKTSDTGGKSCSHKIDATLLKIFCANFFCKSAFPIFSVLHTQEVIYTS